MQIENLYNKVRIPVDEKFLDEILNKYFSISFEDMRYRFYVDEVKTALYNQINIYSKNSSESVDRNNLDVIINKINSDLRRINSSFDPVANNGGINPLANQPGWCVFKSWELFGTEKVEISHRFYFGLPNSVLYEFGNLLYDKYMRENIPFCFKMETHNDVHRTDNVVLYTSSTLLEKNISIIEEIKRERPDLIARCCNPSILTGKFDEKIGYATENKGFKDSYTSLVCSSFILSIQNCLKNYVDNNPNSQIMDMYHKKIQEYINEGKDVSNENVRNRVLLNILVTNIPSFKQILLASYRNELLQKGIDINNICFNDKVKEELEQISKKSNSITSSTNSNDTLLQQANVKLKSDNSDELAKLREEIMNENLSKSSNEELAQLRNDMMNENISKPTVEELGKIRDEYIKMMSGADVDLEVVSDQDSTYSDHMTLPTQSNGMHRR